MELIVALHGKHAVTLDDADDRWLHDEATGMAAMSARISAAWTQMPAARELNRWLDGCLPENGLLGRYRARAQAMLQAAGLAYETPTVAEILWANADAEFAGAIRFETDRVRCTARANDPDAEHRRLTHILAAAWLIEHSDLHRRNLGFLHAEDGSPPRITIAPLYDVSSARGLKNIDQTLAIGIARQLGLTRIRPRVWMAHADKCGLDPEETIEIVRATARRMPDAVAQARDEARTGDENKAQASVDRRVTEILRYADARHRTFEQALTAMGRRSG